MWLAHRSRRQGCRRSQFIAVMALFFGASSFNLRRLRWWKQLHSLGGNELFDVFANQIRFEIDRVAKLALAQSRCFVCVRDDPDTKPFLPNARHRQADAVHSD